MSEATTRGIKVTVLSEYLPQQSAPPHRWFFVYQVTIENGGEETVQLLSREWVITDAEGRTEVVRGPGVVGEQPMLQVGESFQYVSGCPLPTPIGTMKGSYTMTSESGALFEAEIAEFVLKDPMALN